ncbi:MAG: DUF4249 domain-containing protein [Duncaniella sp.]|nr:DUF4249 domain-containing protein [Duncaniella sp.]
MAILRYIIILFAATLLTACYEDFDPKIDTRPVLCLNSLIVAGEPIEVEVTHTWMFNDKEAERNHAVRDATVTILADGKVVGSAYRPEEGDTITIIAESPLYGSATAEVIVPYATPIGKVEVTPVVTDIRGGDEDFFHYGMLADITFNLNIELDVNDPAEIDNYYRFRYSEFSKRYDYDGTYAGDLTVSRPECFSLGQFIYDAEPIFKEHIGVFETVMGNDWSESFLFFSDRQFSGRTYTLHLKYTGNTFRVKSSQYDESLLECGLILSLTTVSQSYYNWAVYKWNADDGILGNLSDIGLAETQWGYSNVSTGAGVVAAQSSTSYPVDLKDFLKKYVNE